MSGKIVALEEDPIRSQELTEALESPGHHLKAFDGYFAALHYLKENDADLILCDIHLQNSSAFEFLAAVKKIERAKTTNFVFYCIEPSQLTKPFLDSISLSAKKLGAFDVVFLEKYDAGELCRAIETHLPPGIERKCANAA